MAVRVVLLLVVNVAHGEIGVGEGGTVVGG